MKKAGRFLTVLVAAVLALGVALGVSACSNEEDAVRSAFDAEMQAAMTYGSDAEEELGADLVAELDDAGINVEDLWNAVLAHHSYTVDEVTIDDSGETAEVTVTVTNVDFNAVVTQWTTEMTEYFMSEEGMAELQSDESAAMNTVYQMLIDDLSSDSATTATETTTVTMQKTDGNWVSSEASINLILPGYGA